MSEGQYEYIRDTRYEDMPVIATPGEAWNEKRYVGELNMYADSPHDLTIKVPSPPKGLYTYSVTIIRKGPRED